MPGFRPSARGTRPIRCSKAPLDDRARLCETRQGGPINRRLAPHRHPTICSERLNSPTRLAAGRAVQPIVGLRARGSILAIWRPSPRAGGRSCNFDRPRIVLPRRRRGREAAYRKPHAACLPRLPGRPRPNEAAAICALAWLAGETEGLIALTGRAQRGRSMRRSPPGQAPSRAGPLRGA